ncbi:MAG: ATP-binding protein [Acidimicrobiia bacterium]|nr:ATP-binding protein [Acidimicrobiia bacterium]
MPIRLRLALSFAAITLVLVGAGGLLFSRSFRSGLEDSLEPGLRAQADTVAAEVRASGAAAALDDAQGGPARGRDVVAQVLDGSGQVLATTLEAGDRPVIQAATVRDGLSVRVFANTRVGGEREPYRVLAAPVESESGRQVVVVATSLEATDEAVARVRDALVIGGASAVLLAAIGGWFLSSAALRPVERMRRQAADISEHDAASRLQVPGTRDEIAALATTMNDLLARLHDALSRQRAFVADAGHELRTPLAVLRTELELGERPQRTEAELRDALHHAAGSVDRLARLTEDLLLLARTDEVVEPRFEPVRMPALVGASAATMRDAAARADVSIIVEGPEQLDAVGIGSLLQRAVDNLLENALRYSPAGSTITVRVRTAGPDAVIEVLDKGPGFPPEFLPHAFERFRRADDARARTDGGSGLGLAIVLAVAEAHGGTATAGNRPEGGAVVTVTIRRRVSGEVPREM